jgi:hypothetical protein
MARSIVAVIAVILAWGNAVWAEPTPNAQAGAPPWKRDGQRERRAFDGTPSPEFENVRKALDALTPEQRKRFQENFLRWANLPPEEKKALRDREEMRKKFMEQEVQAALQESGLQLEGERREQFVKRYGEERKKIEEQLRKDLMEKRRPLVRELIARLRTEFSGAVPPPTEPALSPTAPEKN